MNLKKCAKCKIRDNLPKIRNPEDNRILHFKCFEVVNNCKIWYDYRFMKYHVDYDLEIIS